jgi:chorismate dehydratase
VGHIGFLNSLPFLVGLDASPTPPPFTLVSGPPTELNRRLLAGELDVSPISSIEYAAHAEALVLLPGLCIASDGPVASVLLATRVPPDQLTERVVALDPSSATSHVLVKLVLWERYRVRPRFEVRERSSLDGLRADAALVIGDQALRTRLDPNGWQILDLGEEWKALSGCRMVYAVWAARRAFAARHPGRLEAVRAALADALVRGLADPQTLSTRAAALSGHAPDFLRTYYRLLGYTLGEPERLGLAEFYRRAARHGLLPAAPALSFAAAPSPPGSGLG